MKLTRGDFKILEDGKKKENTQVMHHAFNIFLFNMALADLLIALFNVGTSWTYNVYYDWW